MTNPYQTPGGIATADSPIGHASRSGEKRPSKAVIWLATLPAMVTLVLFYSLALHMYVSLGGWPEVLGERGFSRALTAHANTAFMMFTAMFFTGIFVWPFVFPICVLVKPLRPFSYYLAAFQASNVICLVLMQLGPSKFVWWWWD